MSALPRNRVGTYAGTGRYKALTRAGCGYAFAPLLLAVFLFGAHAQAPADRPAFAERIIQQADVTGGLIVHLGGDPALTAALRLDERFVVQGLETDPQRVCRAREIIQAVGAYGPVSVRHLTGNRLPYLDRLVNLLVVSDELGVAREEMERVLAPGGALVRANRGPNGSDEVWVKPWPDSLDQWPHHLHSPNNNAVSRDTEVALPKGAQWLAGPLWSRFGQMANSVDAMVVAGGRVFHTDDLAPRASLFFPPEQYLIARNAFNGKELWRRPLGEWRTDTIYKKSFPTVLHRRLAAVGDEVYVTLGLNEPVSVLDATTGRTLRALAGTEKAEEILTVGDLLFFTRNTDPVELSKEFYTLHEPRTRHIVALDRRTGTVRWQREGSVTQMTLTIEEGRVFYHDGRNIRALDGESGQQLWTSDTAIPLPEKIPAWYGATLVAVGNRVLFTAGPEDLGSLWETTGINPLYAFDAATGEQVWTVEHPATAYKSPKDVFVIGGNVMFTHNSVGMVWKNRPEAGPPTTWETFVHDLKSGELVKVIPPDVPFARQHHRCYRGKATERFLLSSVRGIDLLDISNGEWSMNNWVRSGCNIGFTPACGLLYFTPHACQCYQQMLIKGFWALRGESALPTDVPSPTNRLVRGDRSFKPDDDPPSAASSWRSGISTPYRRWTPGAGRNSGVLPPKAPLIRRLRWTAAASCSVRVMAGCTRCAPIPAHCCGNTGPRPPPHR